MDNSFEQISLAAKNYADALVQVAQDGKASYDELTSGLRDISDTFDASNDLREVLINPTIKDDVKIEIIESIFDGKINSYLINFLKVLITKKRINEFSEIYRDFIDKLNEINDIQPVTIISAVDLSEDYKKTILNKLNQKLGKNIQPKWSLDEDIIAGLMIKIDDNVIDMSLRNRIDKLSKSLMLK